MALIDAQQRQDATQTHLSFIVQAPAGSGKTEILTQRYLRLLGTVSAPEQIIALTFTRKAAGEMRQRIILALQQAARNQAATSAHQQQTLDFAHNALARSQQLQWDLLEQTNRLKIITIDALCQSINQSIPLLEKQIAYTSISEVPQAHYANAARQCLQFALESSHYQEAISTLLLHVDNKQDSLLNLFSSLLAQRDQWLYPLFQARAHDKTHLEEALDGLFQQALTRFKKSLPAQLAHSLIQLCRELALIENNPQSPRYVLQHWYALEEIDHARIKALASLLLTGEETFRVAFDHHVGLKRDACSATVYTQLKQNSKELLAQLNECPDFLQALIHLHQCPAAHYEEGQWAVLQALFVILPLLVSHLQLQFTEQNEVDFTTISQQALAALGDADNPTDLALYLDHTLHHLLVDEFQDTSMNQFELLTQLVQGWQPNEGKTLFIVGDPMQSIYRFRQAEVGLFFRAKAQGIGPITLQFLQLQCNFRSTETLVHWVNRHFVSVFPQQSDIDSGAVSFHASVAVNNTTPTPSRVLAFKFNTKQQEAEQLIQMLRAELERDREQSIAILVRSRTHLTEIVRLLRRHHIPFQGTNIDLLAKLMHLRDVWTLTQALLLPANRLSWLALLRSPFCGLNLSDLHCIATFDKNKSILHALLHLNELQGLSAEGRERAHFFIQVMQQALLKRAETRLSEWVSQTLNALSVDKIFNANELNDLEQLWILLDRHEQDGRLANGREFIAEFNGLYSQQVTPSQVQIMTIHKSKGLEFDTVFLPGLGAPPKPSDQPMLRWVKLPTVFLMSPIQAAHQEQCDLYDYLGRLDAEKSRYEAQRLFYVAVTRAKSRLYLMDGSAKSSKQSFLSVLTQQEWITHAEPVDTTERIHPLPNLMKLPLAIYSQPPIQAYADTQNTALRFNTPIPRLTGVVMHSLLQWVCNHHPKTLTQLPWPLVSNQLKQMGFDEKTQQEAFATIQLQMKQLFQDPKGLWIISPHEQEQNEYPLLVSQQDRMVTRIIDRTFIADNIRWIIDFKTGSKQALAQHQHQLNQYAYYLSSRSNCPIHCGLYYLANGLWVEWTPVLEIDALI